MRMRVAIVGMGYVGAVSGAALASRGCHVLGVEVNASKLQQLQQGISPVVEPGLDTLIADTVASGHLTATDDITEAVRDCDVIMISVGTPSRADDTVNLEAIDSVTAQLAEAMRLYPRKQTVIVRSTVPPGTTRDRVAPRIKAANPQAVVCHHPEFLREGSAIKDWFLPPMIVWGADHDVDDAAAVFETLYEGIDAPHVEVATCESELMKVACNVFHAVKIDFANEIGTLAAACGANAATVMEAFCLDKSLNISTAYLRPGFAFGGSCLPKDTRGAIALARQHGITLPLIESVLASNEQHLHRETERVLAHGRKPTLLVGLSFKAGTDDLRESPMVTLAERLLGKGVPLRIYDEDLKPTRLVGANAAFIREHLPHLHLLLQDDLGEALQDAQVIVKAKSCKALDAYHLNGKAMIDLTAGPMAAWLNEAKREAA